jgi:hypothetical protein
LGADGDEIFLCDFTVVQTPDGQTVDVRHISITVLILMSVHHQKSVTGWCDGRLPRSFAPEQTPGYQSSPSRRLADRPAFANHSSIITCTACPDVSQVATFLSICLFALLRGHILHAVHAGR